MGSRLTTPLVAVLIAVLAGALALALPRAPRQGQASLNGASLGRTATHTAVLLLQPGLMDAAPDDGGLVSLLSQPEKAAASHYLLTTVPASPAMELAAPLPEERRFSADAAWLTGPGTAVIWRASAPAELRLTRTVGQDEVLRDASRPALIAAAQPVAERPRQVALAVLPGRLAAAAGPPLPKVAPAASEAESPTAPATQAGDRLVRLGGDGGVVTQLAQGAITAVAAGPSGNVALAWVEPGRPPTAGLTVLKPDGTPGWRAPLRAPAHRLALLGADTVIVAAGPELLSLRQGDIVWRRTLPAVPVGLAVTPGGAILVALPTRLLSLTAAGFTAWEMTPRGAIQALRLSPAGTRAALIETGQAEVLILPEG
ncbi:MAG: hypothetical protein ACYC5Y_01480 [Symbiobacteriia bacterium]